MGVLYQLTFPSGKSYIGITTEKLTTRISRHLHAAKTGAHLALSRAIRKYGDIFDRKILVIADDWKYLCELEKKAIEAYNTFKPNGYNLTKGGEGGFGLIHTDESKTKMSIVQSGKVISDAAKIKMRDAKLGTKHTDAHKLSISLALKGKQNSLGTKQSPEDNARKSIFVSQLKWFNNGTKNVRTLTCPDGFVAGRSIEVGIAISAAKIGKPFKPWSDARRAADEANKKVK